MVSLVASEYPEESAGDEEIGGGKYPQSIVFSAGACESRPHRVEVDIAVNSPSVREDITEIEPRLWQHLLWPRDTGYEKEDE